MATHKTLALMVACLATATATYSEMCQRYTCPNVAESPVGPSTVLRTMTELTHWASTSSLTGRRGMFMKLFNYIEGSNADGLKMNMTIPVPRKIVELPNGGMEQTMSFFLPLATPPVPSNPAVTITTMGAGTAFYVRSFTTEKPAGFQGRRWGKGRRRGQGRRGGRRGQGRGQMPADFTDRYADNLATLKAYLTQSDLTFNPSVHYNVGYSSPWTWPKHEEVWVEATASTL